jgi:hypothetical protein
MSEASHLSPRSTRLPSTLAARALASLLVAALLLEHAPAHAAVFQEPVQDAAADVDDVDGAGEADGADGAPGDAAATADLEWLARLGDRCPPHVLRRLANGDDARALAALAATFDESRGWHLRALCLCAWARHVRLHHADDTDARDACLAAIETWLGEGAGPLQRGAALEAADELGEFGEPVLRRVAETSLDTLDRARALRLFARGRELPDYTWFKELVARGGRKAPEDERRDYGAGGALEPLREIAFAELAEEMRGEEIEEALEDRSVAIRVRANRIADQRGDDEADERALALFEDDDAPIALRLWAAESIAREFDRQRHYTYLFEYGVSSGCDPALRNHIALQVRRAMPQRVLDLVRKQLGKGKLLQKLFAIDALPLTVMSGLADRPTRGPGGDDEEEVEQAFRDEKVLEALRNGATDGDVAVRVASIEALVEREDFDAVDALERAARKAKTEHDRAALVRARVALGGPEKDVLADARALAASAAGVERRAGLVALVALDPDANEDTLRAAFESGAPHEVLALVDAIVERGWGRGVGLLIGALDRPEPSVREAARAALWRTTARDEGPTAADWAAWWDGVRSSFAPVEEDVAEEFLEELGDPLRREGVLGEFLGIELRHRSVAVAFDLGPEALAPLVARREQRGAIAASGLELVRGELSDLARRVGPGVALRVYANAAGDDGPWAGHADLGDEAAVALAAWFETYAPVRTTALVALVDAALADPACEALVLVASGDTAKFDPEDFEEQRRAFALANRERDLVVHTVAVGRPSRALEWLAQTSGGTHVFVP